MMGRLSAVVAARLVTTVPSVRHEHLVQMLLASTQETPVDFPTSLVVTLIQAGIVGLLLIDVAGPHKFFVPRWTYDGTIRDFQQRLADKDLIFQQRLAEKDAIISQKNDDIGELKATNGTLQSTMSERLIPALVQATDAQRAYTQELARRGSRDGS